MTMRGVWGVGVALVVCAAVALLLGDSVPEAAALYAIRLPAHPYLVGEHFLLLYVAVPLAVIAFVLLLLAPGVLLVLATSETRGLADLVVRGFAASFGVLLLADSAVRGVWGRATPGSFGAILLASGALAFAVLAARVARGARIPDPFTPESRRLLRALALPFLTVVLLLPVLLWQDMTDDGLEALEAGRSLAWHLTPRFPDAGGFLGLGIGMVSMSYPVHWFAMWFGPIEAAARLPLALYLPVLFLGLVALIEWAQPRRMRGLEEGALMLPLAVFVVALGYSASYNPYSPEVAAPAAFETLTVLCMVGATWALWSERTGALLGFALIGYFARPSGLLFLILLGGARWLCEPEQRRTTLLRVGGAIALCIAAFVLYEQVYLPYVSAGAPIEYGSDSIRGRLRFLSLFDVKRLLWLLIPTGILPALALGAARAQDAQARTLALVSVVYFAFFYVQAFVALHHFVPAMILPLVVFWRIALERPARGALVGAVAVAAAVSLWLSLPPHFELYRGVRQIGLQTAYRIGDYDGEYAEVRQALDRRSLVYELFPVDWTVEDPATVRVGASLGIVFYATRVGDGRGGEPVNYLVQPRDAPPPDGFTLVAERDDGTVWVRDLERWERDRAAVPSTAYRAAIYEIPRETLFRHVGEPAGAYTLDLKVIPGLRRLF